MDRVEPLPLHIRLIFLGIGFLIFISLKPWIATQNYNRALTFVRCGLYSKAERQFKKAIFLMPNFTAAYNGLGFMYEGMGAWDKAIPVYKESFRYDPKNSIGYFRIGFYYAFEEKDYLEAIKWLQMAIEVDKDNWQAYIWLGICYQYLGLDDLAGKYYKEAEMLKKKGYRSSP